MADSLNNKVVNATKWSGITEIVAKLVTPVTSMVLARLLTPEAFGIVATLTMIISFAEIFTDAGFQKYLIQHEFKDGEDREQSTTVAFWSNLIMSFLLWGLIAIFADPLATLVGNPGMGNVLIIACVSIPLEAFSSIQMALYKRDFDFKTLFKVRMVGICVPLVVTIPLAFWLRSFWALVIGTIAVNVCNAVLLTAFSKWKPRLYYSWAKFKEMFSFTMWSMFEQVSIWLTGYVDVFAIGVFLNQYYLGLYKTSISIVGQITALITATTTPVLFSALSRLLDSETEFKNMFFKFQKLVGLLVIPLGVGIYCYQDLLTAILLGDQWAEAAPFIGLWGLTSALAIVLAHYSSEVYRSMGKPRLSVLAQWLHIIVLYPTVLVSVRYGYETLYVARALVRLELILVQLIIMYKIVRVSPLRMLSNIAPACFAAVVMGIVAIALQHYFSALWIIVASVIVSIAVYIGIIALFPQERNIGIQFINKFLKR